MSIIDTRRHNWSLSVAEDFHRTYTLDSLVFTDDNDDGPLMVANASGLPLVGNSFWKQGNEWDAYAICLPTMQISLHNSLPGEAGKVWKVSQKFSTKLPEEDVDIQNPLARPPRVSGANNVETIVARFDKDDNLIRSSSWEPFEGPQTEYRQAAPTVRIQQNVGSLNLAYCTAQINKVNSSAMWGLAARCIELVDFNWEKVPYRNYLYYYTRTFDFEIHYNTVDRWIPDRGKRARGYRDEATGDWVASGSTTDPDDFSQYRDKDLNPAIAMLNGDGYPAKSEAEIYHYLVQKHYETNFFLLGGIPASF